MSAGLATAVYAASEGLSALTIDCRSFGGQAGASPRTGGAGRHARPPVGLTAAVTLILAGIAGSREPRQFLAAVITIAALTLTVCFGVPLVPQLGETPILYLDRPDLLAAAADGKARGAAMRPTAPAVATVAAAAMRPRPTRQRAGSGR